MNPNHIAILARIRAATEAGSGKTLRFIERRLRRAHVADWLAGQDEDKLAEAAATAIAAMQLLDCHEAQEDRGG